METALAAVAETLAHEFGDLRSSAVVRVLSACVDEFPYDGPHFIEQAARARLLLLREPRRRARSTPGRDALDVCLHDSDLADEVELTGRLMVAANESDGALPQAELDTILGVSVPGWPAIPAQGLPGRERPFHLSFRSRA